VSASARKGLAVALAVVGLALLGVGALFAFDSAAYSDDREVAALMFGAGMVVMLLPVMVWPIERTK